MQPMNRPARFFAVLLLLAPGLLAVAALPDAALANGANDIDCAKPRSADNRLICADTALMALHQEMDAAYQAVRTATLDDRYQVYARQDAWIAGREKACAGAAASGGGDAGKDCIARMTRERTRVLKSQAGPLKKARAEAEALLASVPGERKKCEKAAKPLFESGVTARMIEGTRLNNACLERLLGKLVAAFYHPGTFDNVEGGLDGLLGRLEGGVERLYWGLYTGPKACGIMGCGTIWHLFPAGDYTRFLDAAIDTTLKRIEEERR